MPYERKRTYESRYSRRTNKRSTRNRTIAIGISLVVLIVAIVVGGYRLVDTPLMANAETAAEDWVNAVVNEGAPAATRLTCDELPADQKVYLQSSALVLSLLNPNRADGILQQVIERFSLNYIVELIVLDPSELTYATQSKVGATAEVAVTGTLYLDVAGLATIPISVSDLWTMVWENDKWKWCGRQAWAGIE